MTQPSTATPQISRSDAWSHYWVTGVQHSCPGSFSANYTGRIGKFWVDVFAELAEQARVLDACCGNATMSQLLLDSKYGAQVASVDAVDAARVDPHWLRDAPEQVAARFHLHPETDVAAMPFAAASFDLCISHYGIEYAGAPALRECSRVLRPGGRLAAVMHHADSLPVRIALEEIAHIDWLLSDEGLLACAQALIPSLARAGTPEGREALRSDAQANAARAAFNAALQAVKTRIDSAHWADVLLEQRELLMQLVSQVPHLGAAVAIQYLEQMREALRAARLRQQELREFALDEAGISRLFESFDGSLDRREVLHFENGEIAGWALVATRA